MKIIYTIVSALFLTVCIWALSNIIFEKNPSDIKNSTHINGIISEITCKYIELKNKSYYLISFKDNLQPKEIRVSKHKCNENIMTNATGKTFSGYFIKEYPLEITIEDKTLVSFNTGKTENNILFFGILLCISVIGGSLTFGYIKRQRRDNK